MRVNAWGNKCSFHHLRRTGALDRNDRGKGAAAADEVFIFAPQVNRLEGLRNLSPCHYYLGGDPLCTGFHLGYLVTIPLALLCIALW